MKETLCVSGASQARKLGFFSVDKYSFESNIAMFVSLIPVKLGTSTDI